MRKVFMSKINSCDNDDGSMEWNNINESLNELFHLNKHFI